MCVCVFFGWCLFPVVQVSSIAAHDAAVATGAMPQILLWVSAFEAISSVAVVQMLEGSGRMPGDFGFDPYNLYSKPGMEKKKVRFFTSHVAWSASRCCFRIVWGPGVVFVTRRW